MEREERLREECRFMENAIISVLNSRPRYLKRIPKKFYLRHFLEIHRQDSQPRVEQTDDGLRIYSTLKVGIYDRIRRKYIKF